MSNEIFHIDRSLYYFKVEEENKEDIQYQIFSHGFLFAHLGEKKIYLNC